MLYMLDTNIVSYLLERNETVVRRFDAAFFENDIAISAIVKFEIQRGIAVRKSKRLQSAFDIFCRRIPVIPFSDSDSDVAARIYADLKAKGQLIEDADILIGASALANGAVLVTNNTKHLGRIEGLRIENWVE